MLKIDEDMIQKAQNLKIATLEFDPKLIFMFTKEENKLLLKCLTEQVLKHNQDKAKDALLY